MPRHRTTNARPPRTDGRQIVFAPEALRRLAAGFDRLAALMAATLGPTQGPVLNARTSGSVELLTDAGAIARRVVELPGRCHNTGAMIGRHLAWQMHEQFGDGAATAAALARAMVREGVRRIEAGIDPALIRRGLDHALPAALAALETQAVPVTGQDALAAVATGITGDSELGAVLGEIVDVLGPAAALTIEELPVPYLDREYVEGAYWRAHPAARSMIPDGQREVVLDNPLIMVADQDLHDAADVGAALDLAARAAGRRPLLIVPAQIGERALTTVTLNHARGTVTAIVALMNVAASARTDDFEDLAALTGGALLADARGKPPRRPRLEDLGEARRAVVTRSSLTVAGAAGDRDAVAERCATLQRRASELSPRDDDWQRFQGRIARLSGGIAILKIGARTGTELTHRRAQAEKAFRILSGLLAGGVVPGGGVAYLTCAQAVSASRATCSVPGAEHGVDLLATALGAPFTQIVRNHGLYHPPLALAEARRRGGKHGLDVLTGEYVDMQERGILDSLAVARGALQTATSAAISLLTTGVVVLPADAKRAQQVTP